MSGKQSKKKEFAKNTAIILFGKIFTQLIIFLLLPIYTSKLSTEEYGTVDLIITYVTLLAPLISLQLENAIFRFLVDARNDEELKKKYISSSSFTLLILMVLTIIISVVINVLFEIEYLKLLLLLIITTMTANYLLQVARGLGDNVGYAISSMLIGISNLISNLILLIKFNLGIEGMLISQIIANILGIIFLIIKNRIYKYESSKKINKKLNKELLKYSLPLIPSNICWWIVNVSDRTLLSLMLNVGKNGIYSVSNKFSTAYVTLFNMVNLSWTESVALHITDEDKDEFLSEMSNSILKIFSAISLVIIGILPFVFNILVDSNFNEAYIYIPMLLLGSFLNVIIGLFSSIYIAKKITKELAKTSLFASIINIVINLIFIKSLGIWAAVLSTVISFAVMSIYRYIDIQKYVKIKFEKKFIISFLIIFTISYVIYIYNHLILNIFNLTILIIYSIILNKEIIINIKNKLIKKKNK